MQPILDSLFTVVLAWEAAKERLALSIHFSHEALHVLVGVMLFMLSAVVMRRPVRSLRPIVPVAVVELINEAFDFTRYYVSEWPWSPQSSMIDVALTLLPPTMIALTACKLSHAAD